MPVNGRKFVRVVKYLLAGVTVCCVSWLACVNEWHSRVRLTNTREELSSTMLPMRTIVAYSEGKQAEMDRPAPVTCDSLPAFPKPSYINRTWPGEGRSDQDWQHVPGTHMSLYAAYYDDRAPQRYVRILATVRGRSYLTEDRLFCQTRTWNGDYMEDSVEVVAAKPLEIWYDGWDVSPSEVDIPLLLSCPLTESLRGPSVVSVVTEPCDDSSNAFHLNLNQEQKERRLFTICVKDMKFEKDISQNLVEWIETNKILGVDMIDIYVDEIAEKTKEILLHYQQKGIVRLFHVPIKHKSDRSLWQRRRDHVLTYNDCLYRNIKESEYIVPLDIDEIIVPKIADTWPELLNRLNKLGWESSLCSFIIIQNVFFFQSMQYYQNYKSMDRQGVQSKMYVEGDEVRIKINITLEIGEVELIVDSNNVNNEVINYSQEDEVLFDKYKSRCGSELPTPILAKHVVRSDVISRVGDYSKSWMLTKKVLTAFNHYPLNSLILSNHCHWSPPFEEVQLNHYKESCNTKLVWNCEQYFRQARIDRTALRLQSRLTRALAEAICTGINVK